MSGSEQDGTYPRPLLVRAGWTSLDGPWDFGFDDADEGLSAGWWERDGVGFDRTIVVPFAPESAASGIGDHGQHPVVWYRRTIRAAAMRGTRWLLHFGAVDREASVWVDGQHVGGHLGGQTAFSLDITDQLGPGEEHAVVVRAFDDPTDPSVPRGKQDWLDDPHSIWYRRSTGIWRTVWIEQVPEQYVRGLRWETDPAKGTVTGAIDLAQSPAPGTTVRVRIEGHEQLLADVATLANARELVISVDLAVLRNAQDRERWLWSPEQPTLLDAHVELLSGDRVIDRVDSYVGVRSVATVRGSFVLNGRPTFVRSVLEQGYWPDSQLTPPDALALKREVEHILSLGFNAARIHQKVEDPRFLYWADRLGLMLWGETAAAYAFDVRAMENLTREWLEIVAQERSHPSVVTWVPINESWGVQDITQDPAQRSFVQAIAALTRALDPSRPVVSNDGWEHVDSDILSVHDYTTRGSELAERWSSPAALERMRTGFGPSHHALDASPAVPGVPESAPVMVTEFGGIAYAAKGTWGYAVVSSDAEFASRIGGLFAALHASPLLAGFCYTQLTDTMQESNGLLTADRRPKLPLARLRAMITGRKDEQR